MGKVSIITPTFNSEKYIKQTYESLKKQSFNNWEWLVTDDCSTDNTLSILSEISKNDGRVKIFINKINSGAAVSRNKSIDNATGTYLAFLDSDDLWMESKLEEQLTFMQNNNCLFSFTGYELLDSDTPRTVDTTHSNKRMFTYKDMLAKKATLGCSTVILRRSFLGDKRMPNIRTGQDYAFWLSILKEGNIAVIYNKALTKYRLTPGSISSNKLKKAKRQWQIYRELERISFLMAFSYFISYAIRAVFRKA